MDSGKEVRKWDAVIRHQAAALYEQWCQAFKARQTVLSYDVWLERKSGWDTPGAPHTQDFESEGFRFTLIHGWRYEINNRSSGVRVFDCLIHGRSVFIAMVSRTGRRGPWICPVGLLSRTDLKRIFPLGRVASVGIRGHLDTENRFQERRSGWGGIQEEVTHCLPRAINW